MGRFHALDERMCHEGHLVAYAPREWIPAPNATAIGSGRPVAVLPRYRPDSWLRELGVRQGDEDFEVHGVLVIGYACSCGWRSPYVEVEPLLVQPVEWSGMVVCSEPLDDRLAARWWDLHVRDALGPGFSSESERAEDARLRKRKNLKTLSDSGQSSPRVCRLCGRALPIDLTKATARLRQLHGEIGPRRSKVGESDAERRAREADYDQSRAIHAWVSVGLLADELDGICGHCSSVNQELAGRRGTKEY